ncbi:CotS family spore coat protein [Clostridium algidicarnis]|uniref:CotS family spore coat protein n=1 Tax=Clostridium algidicarnis TaxID=37659 RepID=UPI001C0CDC69|nr:CotS family spore coat protein [Clostridium algidicarnis]MBU3195767.1 CotS family spore coat protein [Clostridium algidicarnis]
MPSEAKRISYGLLLESNIKKVILPYYDLQDYGVTQIKFKDTDKQRAVYKIDNGINSYCLKKVYYNIEELLFVYSAMEWLYRNKINVPRILPTNTGGRFVMESDMLFILSPWIDGNKCDYDNVENIINSALNLSKFHNACDNFIPIKGSKYKEAYADITLSTEKHFEQLLNCSNKAFKYGDKFSKIFLNNFESSMKLAKLALDVSSTISMSNLSISLCHGDYVNKNIIFDNKNNIWTIDFDKCKIDYCTHDISYFLRRLLKRDNTRWDLEIAISALEIYDSIRPLSLDEYKYIFIYLAFPQKYWKISKDYYNNINKCNKSSFCNLLNKAASKNDFQLQFAFEFKDYIQNKFKCTLN